MYRELNAKEILRTIKQLKDRIARRFPDSGLASVSAELLTISDESTVVAAALGRPVYALRGAAWVLIVGMIAMAVAPFLLFNVRNLFTDFGEFVQVFEAGINDVVFLGIGIYFIATLEGRIKRRRALRKLRELRSICHIVDMHQLTKDPELLMSGGTTTSGDSRLMSREDLAKYLDYCSEMLSLTSKVAALYMQSLDDSVVLDAVNEIEGLSSGLSRKMWQKIMILDTIGASAANA